MGQEDPLVAEEGQDVGAVEADPHPRAVSPGVAESEQVHEVTAARADHEEIRALHLDPAPAGLSHVRTRVRGDWRRRT